MCVYFEELPVLNTFIFFYFDYLKELSYESEIGMCICRDFMSWPKFCKMSFIKPSNKTNIVKKIFHIKIVHAMGVVSRMIYEIGCKIGLHFA